MEGEIIRVARIMSRKREIGRSLGCLCNRPAAPSTVAADNRADRRLEAGPSGGAQSPLTQIGRGVAGGGGSGQWEWQVTLARLFLALARVVLFNYAPFESQRKKKKTLAFGSCASPAAIPFITSPLPSNM